MNDYEKAIRDIRQVAVSLEELCSQFIFIGGAVVGLYSTTQGAINTRPTKDIDILSETLSLADYEPLEAELRKKGFKNDTESSVICRWRLGVLVVDIMYPNPKKFGFANEWYQKGIENAIDYHLDKDVKIKIFDSVHFIATKLDAQKNRGERDCRFDKDFADIVHILGNRREFRGELEAANLEVKTYIITAFKNLVQKDIYECILACSADIGGEGAV